MPNIPRGVTADFNRRRFRVRREIAFIRDVISNSAAMIISGGRKDATNSDLLNISFPFQRLIICSFIGRTRNEGINGE